MKTVPLHTVNVNRDAMTKIPAQVPAHEIAVMKRVFGEDNVIDAGATDQAIELDETAEGQRLAEKFGPQPVIDVFGVNYQGAVARELASLDITAKPKGKAAVPA